MIEFRSISKSFGENHLFSDFDLRVPTGSTTCILGPSGCGKTTLLNLAADLMEPDSGRIVRNGSVSYVFQEPRLLPWCTVRENAGYAMAGGVRTKEQLDRLNAVLEALELIDASALLPKEISGGMARRTALARALLAPKDILLLDEPLSSLDPELRSRVISRLSPLLEGSAVVLVTHDYGTAALLSDRILRFSLPPVRIQDVEIDDLETALEQIERIEESAADSEGP